MHHPNQRSGCHQSGSSAFSSLGFVRFSPSHVYLHVFILLVVFLLFSCSEWFRHIGRCPVPPFLGLKNDPDNIVWHYVFNLAFYPVLEFGIAFTFEENVACVVGFRLALSTLWTCVLREIASSDNSSLRASGLTRCSILGSTFWSICLSDHFSSDDVIIPW